MLQDAYTNPRILQIALVIPEFEERYLLQDTENLVQFQPAHLPIFDVIGL